MSVEEKARSSDSVRMLPSALRLKLSAVAESSSGPSIIRYDVISSLRPEYIFDGHAERLRHLPKGLCSLLRIFGVFDALSGEPGKGFIGLRRGGHFPQLRWVSGSCRPAETTNLLAALCQARQWSISKRRGWVTR